MMVNIVEQYSSSCFDEDIVMIAYLPYLLKSSTEIFGSFHPLYMITRNNDFPAAQSCTILQNLLFLVHLSFKKRPLGNI